MHPEKSTYAFMRTLLWVRFSRVRQEHCSFLRGSPRVYSTQTLKTVRFFSP